MLGCYVLTQSDDVGNEGEVEGLNSPDYLSSPGVARQEPLQPHEGNGNGNL